MHASKEKKSSKQNKIREGFIRVLPSSHREAVERKESPRRGF
jgi:hypothetical protein